MTLQFKNQQIRKYLQRLSKRGLIYLGSPYSTNQPDVLEYRYNKNCEFASMFHENGLNWFSPIAMSHTPSLFMPEEVRMDWEAWKRLDLYYADLSSCLVICGLNGWYKSVGLSAEVEHFEKSGKPIYYLNPDNGMIDIFQQGSIILQFWSRMARLIKGK